MGISTLCCLEKVLWMTQWPLCFHRKSNYCIFSYPQNSTRSMLLHKIKVSLFLCGFWAFFPLVMLKFNAELWDRAAVPCIIAPLHRQTALCLHLLEDFLWPMTLFYRRADIRFVLNYKCQFKTSLENWTNTEYTWQPCLFYISGLLWPTSPEGQTHTCLMPQPFSSQWGFSWGFSAAPLWWVQPQESSQLSYPFSETCFEMKITNTKSDLSRLIFSLLGEKARCSCVLVLCP